MTHVQRVAAYEVARGEHHPINPDGACYAVAIAHAEDVTGVSASAVRLAMTYASRWTWPDPAIDAFQAVRDEARGWFDARPEAEKMAALERLAAGESLTTLAPPLAAA